jgi:subtilase family serine protease
MNLSGKNCAIARLSGWCVAFCFTALLFAGEIQAQGHFAATRHVRQEVMTGQAAMLNRLPAAQILRLDLALPLRNEPELDDLLDRIYDPQSPFYHQFLSVQQFTDRFAPTAEDYAAVVRFARQNGLAVTGTSPNRLLVNVSGPVTNVEKALHVTMSSYQHPTEARTFYSADREPSPDLPVALWHVSGLDNFSRPRPASLKKQAAAFTPKLSGSGPLGNFIGSDFRTAYYGGTALTGAGQAVGLVEFAGYNIADVNAYFAAVGQKRTVPVNGVSTDGSSLSCTGSCDDSEQVLDIEVAISMAPGLSQVRVYVSDSSDVSMFNKMATENIAKSLSCSWGWSPADPSSDDPIFKEFAAQGQNLFVASGDSGAYGSTTTYVYPADDAYVTAVGGTDLTTGAGGAWQSETGWVYSGGGVSVNNIAIPSYQKTSGVITRTNKGSKTLRNVPDVAAEANTDNYICYDGLCAGGWGGTSFAAPRWAGYLALANEQAVAKGRPSLGFINPALYSTGLGAGHATGFHDILSGTNGTFASAKGYDLVTGWGSPNGVGLIDDLVPSGAYVVIDIPRGASW